MALSSEVLLHGDAFVGISTSPYLSKDEIIITDNHVRIFNISDRQTYYSWNENRSNRFTHPVICSQLVASSSLNNDEFSYFYGVSESSNLQVWSKKSKGSKNTNKKFETKIESIHEGKELNGDIIVVFMNGSISIVNHAALEKQKLEPRVSTTIPNIFSKKVTIWSDLVSFSNDSQKKGTLSLFLLNKLYAKSTVPSDSNFYELEHIIVKDESPFISFHKSFKIKGEETNIPISCSLDSSNGIFSILWSEGKLNIYQVDISTNKRKQQEILTIQDSIHLSTTYLFPKYNLNDSFESSIKYQSSPVKIISTNIPYSLIAVGIPAATATASSSSSTLITVWDIKHMTILATSNLPTSSSGTTKDMLVRCVAKSIDNSCIIIAQGDKISMCQLSIPNITLASAMMNAQSITDISSSSSFSLFPVYLNDSIDGKDTTSLVERGKELLKKVLTLEIQIRNEKSKEKYKKQVEDCCNQYLQIQSSVKEHVPDYVSQLVSSKELVNKLGTMCVELKLWTLVKELILEHKFTINSIIQHRDSFSSFISHDSTKHSVLDILTSDNRLDIIELLLQSEQELSAKQVVDLLRYFLGNVNKESVIHYERNRKGSKKQENSEQLYKHGINRFLNLILLRNIKEGKNIKSWRNDVPKLQLQSELVHLSIQQVIQLFYFLRSVITSDQDSFSGSIAEQRIKKAVDWINMLLDSHFAELILTEESHKELQELFQLAKDFTKSLPLIESAIGHISLILQNPLSLERNDNTDYSIEVLNL